MTEQTTHRPIADIERDWRCASEYMAGHYAVELIQAYRSMLKSFIWRVMGDDHIVAIKAIDSCQDKSEKQALVALTVETAKAENDADVLRWMEQVQAAWRASGE